MRGAGAARGLPVVDLCLIDIFHSDTILPPSLPLVLCDQLGLLAITIFPLHPYLLYSTSLIYSLQSFTIDKDPLAVPPIHTLTFKRV